ncbi:hypothetical protein LINPERHAP2_LOCUS27485 [Linum perenne]
MLTLTVIGIEAGNGQAPLAPLVEPLHLAQANGIVNGDQQPLQQIVAAEDGNQAAAAEEALVMQSKRKSHV